MMFNHSKLFSIKFPDTEGIKDIQIFSDHLNRGSAFTMRKEMGNKFAVDLDAAPSVYFLDENLATFMFSIFLKKSSRMNKVINRKIDQLIQSGIVQKLEDYRLKAIKLAEARRNDEAAQQKAKILTMDHLGLCFVIIAICWGISFVVFLLECVVGYCKR
jgi:uncharacterized protein YqgQ